MANQRKPMSLPDDKIEELRNAFQKIDTDGSGNITLRELNTAFRACGAAIPGYQLQDLLQKYDYSNLDGNLNFIEFQQLYYTAREMAIIRDSNKKKVEETSTAPSKGTAVVKNMEEQIAFSNWINSNLASDVDCKNILPLNSEGNDLYQKCSDGILLCKLINKAQPGTIDERVVNMGMNLSLSSKMENLTLALKSAQSIGCTVNNIGLDHLHKGIPHQVLGLLWQIIRTGLFSHINLPDNHGLVNLSEEGETIEDLMGLTPEQILVRWFNHHLRNSDSDRANEIRIRNFGGDFKNSLAYYYLIQQIAPANTKIDMSGISDGNTEKRAEKMLKQAERLNCRAFVSARDVTNGNAKLNLAFVANLFNNHPALGKVTDSNLLKQIVDQTREKMYRNWMNSLGVSPFISYVYYDLQNILVYFQLFDKIKPGLVNYNCVPKGKEILGPAAAAGISQMCNYVIELGKQLNFSMVGIDASKLAAASEHKSCVLALLFQLMKNYTLSAVSKLSGTDKQLAESAIVSWANKKLSKKKKTLSSFSDQKLSDGVIVIDVIDSIKANLVNYSLVKQGSSKEEKTSNAILAISLARKLGADVYALPQDIVEVKQNMVMFIFACLMAAELENEQRKTP